MVNFYILLTKFCMIYSICVFSFSISLFSDYPALYTTAKIRKSPKCEATSFIGLFGI